MNILDKALNLIGLARAKSLNLPLASGLLGDSFILWSSGKKVSAQKAMEVYNSWVYACVRAISEELAKFKFRLFQVKKDGAHEEIFEHELLDLLDGVNPFQTGYELRYLTGSHLELTGNAYWLLDGVKNEGGKPKAIFILNPSYVQPIKARLPEFIKGYKYAVDGEARDLKTYEVLHFKYPDPNDPYEGIGTVQAIAKWIDSDNYASQVNLKYFLNGARLGGLLKSDAAISDAQMKTLRASFEALYKGADNAYRVAVLPKGVEYTEASDTPKDMDFANLQQVMRDKILAGFRVPKTILGTAESETNRATAETANYVFAARTIKPKMELIVQQLNEFLVPRYGDNLYLDFDDPVPEDRAQRITEMQAAVGSQPVISVNEAREEYFGLEGVENGDEVSRPFQFALSAGKPKPKVAKREQQKTISRRPSVRYAKNAKVRKEISSEIAKSIAEAIKEAAEEASKVKQKAKEKITSLTDADWEILWKGFVARTEPFEKAQKEAVQKFNAQQKKEVLKNLENIAKAIGKNDIFNREEWVGVLIDLSSPILTELYEKEGKEAIALLGSDEFALTPEVRKALKRSIELMARSYNDTTLDLLKAKLEEGLKEGLSLAELEDRVSEIYEFSDEERAARVARTETFRIANDATQEAWKQTGVVKSIKWFTAADERVCPYCEPMHGKVVGIEESFFEKGDEVTGSDGTKLSLEYDDVEHPPLHVSCRCYIRPEEISLE